MKNFFIIKGFQNIFSNIFSTGNLKINFFINEMLIFKVRILSYVGINSFIFLSLKYLTFFFRTQYATPIDFGYNFRPRKYNFQIWIWGNRLKHVCSGQKLVQHIKLRTFFVKSLAYIWLKFRQKMKCLQLIVLTWSIQDEFVCFIREY